METLLATLAATLPEAATATAAEIAAAEAAAAAAAETAAAAAAAETAAGVTTAGLSAIPEVAAATLPEATAAAIPEATGIMQAGSNVPGILQGAGTASPEALASSNAPGILTGTASATPESIAAAETATAPEASGILQANNAVYPEYGQLPQLGTETNIPGAEATSMGPNYAPVAPDAAQVADSGAGSMFDKGFKNASDLWDSASDKFNKGADWMEKHPKASLGLGLAGAKVIDAMTRQKIPGPEKYTGPLSKYHLASNYQPATATPNYYTPTYGAQGGIMSLAMGGPATTPQPGQMYPQSQQANTQFATPTQMPTSAEVVNSGYEPPTNPYTGNMPLKMAEGGQTTNPLLNFYKQNVNPKFKEAPTADTGINEDIDPDTRLQDPLTAANTRARKLDFMTKATPFKPQQINPQLAQAQQQAVQAAGGGIMGYSLGGYAHGGNPRLLKGPGDGMSDNIPATIADKQPARLADGEFVVPADVVSHLGNGSTDAGASKLHTMMDKVRVARTGKKKQGTQINPNKYMPA